MRRLSVLLVPAVLLVGGTARASLDAALVDTTSTLKPDDSGAAKFKACTGEKFRFAFEVENIGASVWSDDGGAGEGQGVGLSTPSGMPDKLVGADHISIKFATSTLVYSSMSSPPGLDCNDAPMCVRTIFAKDGGIKATAPSTPGVYVSNWQLKDNAVGFFGPAMQVTFNVVACAAGAGGAGGGAAAGAGGGSSGPEGAGGAGGGGDAGSGSSDGGSAGAAGKGDGDAGAAGEEEFQGPESGSVAPGVDDSGSSTKKKKKDSEFGEEAPQDTGGCSAGRSPSSAAALGLLGSLVLVLRRRRRRVS